LQVVKIQHRQPLLFRIQPAINFAQQLQNG
jgi:hypothetical protein